MLFWHPRPSQLALWMDARQLNCCLRHCNWRPVNTVLVTAKCFSELVYLVVWRTCVMSDWQKSSLNSRPSCVASWWGGCIVSCRINDLPLPWSRGTYASIYSFVIGNGGNSTPRSENLSVLSNIHHCILCIYRLSPCWMLPELKMNYARKKKRYSQLCNHLKLCKSNLCLVEQASWEGDQGGADS